MKLTPRELEVLRLRSDGLTIKAVAYQLGISSGTVKNICTHAYEKLGVFSFVEAMHELGWVRSGENE